jgi:hypothetical protein
LEQSQHTFGNSVVKEIFDDLIVSVGDMTFAVDFGKVCYKTLYNCTQKRCCEKAEKNNDGIALTAIYSLSSKKYRRIKQMLSQRLM